MIGIFHPILEVSLLRMEKFMQSTVEQQKIRQILIYMKSDKTKQVTEDHYLLPKDKAPFFT